MSAGSWQSALRALGGNKVGAAIGELHRTEDDLAAALVGLGDRHVTDHEVYYVARDIAAWSREHVVRLAEAGTDYGLELSAEPSRHARDDDTLVQRLTHKGAEAMGRHHEPMLALLAGLRHVHRMAAGVSLDWEVLAQTAQALHDQELLDLAEDCHPQTLRQLRWANAKVKELSAQAMIT